MPAVGRRAAVWRVRRLTARHEPCSSTKSLWSDARLVPPERFNSWPLVADLAAPGDAPAGDRSRPAATPADRRDQLRRSQPAAAAAPACRLRMRRYQNAGKGAFDLSARWTSWSMDAAAAFAARHRATAVGGDRLDAVRPGRIGAEPARLLELDHRRARVRHDDRASPHALLERTGLARCGGTRRSASRQTGSRTCL